MLPYRLSAKLSHLNEQNNVNEIFFPAMYHNLCLLLALLSYVLGSASIGALPSFQCAICASLLMIQFHKNWDICRPPSYVLLLTVKIENSR